MTVPVPGALEAARKRLWLLVVGASPIEELDDNAAALRLLDATHDAAQRASYQARTDQWMRACFPPEVRIDRTERSDRFLEEAIELVQSMGETAARCHALVDYVFGRPSGESIQEVGGVMVCLAALCTAAGMDMAAAGEAELARVWTKIETIRAKHAAKPKGSTLPGYAAQPMRDAAQWQPIETAPRDGTRVLLFWAEQTDGDAIAIGAWGVDLERDAGWDIETGETWLMPTHWQPLPTPPSAAPGNAGEGAA